MVKAGSKHTPPQGADEYTIDDAFQYLTRVVGIQDNLAIYELTEAFLAGRLAATCRHFVDGKLSGQGVVRSDFWRDYLALELAEGQARVKPLKALELGEYEYLLPLRIVRILWPSGSVPSKEQPRHSRAGRKSEFEWDAMHAEAVKRLYDDGYPSDDNVSQFTRDLLDWYQNRFPEGSTPDFETARKYVRQWVEGYRRSLP
jgi:hypothetical protein